MSRFWELVEALRTWRIESDNVTHPTLPSTPIITVLPLEDPEKTVKFFDEKERKQQNNEDQEESVLVSITTPICYNFLGKCMFTK